MASAAAFALGTPAQAPAGQREARVLELLGRIPHLHGRLYATNLVRTTNEFGHALVTPRVLSCGVGWRPPFDPALARQLARELCTIYGLQPAADAPAPVIQSAVLDSFDERQRIGLKLRGNVQEHAETGWPTIVYEPAERDLDVAEHAQLSAAGVRVHAADVASFWAAASSDQMTTTLAYLASVATFLNEVTDGEDVDWDALLPFAGRWLTVPRPRPQRGLQITPYAGGSNLTVERELQLRLAVDPATAWVMPDTLQAVVANAGRPVTFQLFELAALRGTMRAQLQQADARGKTRLLAESDNGMFFLPGTFDSTRPFTVRLRLQPGEYRVTTMGWISGASAR